MFEVGQKVIRRVTSVYGCDRVVVIDRVTATQAIAEGTRFHRDSGVQIASGYRRDRIEAATPEKIQQVQDKSERSKLANKLRHATTWATLPLSKLRRIMEIVEEETDEQGD